jgi:hypothetical protein
MWNPFRSDRYVRAKADGTVTSVKTGLVVVDGKEYRCEACTMVIPGQPVTKGQPIGRKK